MKYYISKALLKIMSVSFHNPINIKKKYLYFAIGASIFFLLLSLINRTIHTDDAWLGEQAYWLAKKGYVKSELLRGFIGYEDRQYVYHKFFIWLGALIIKLVSFKLYGLKSISLFFLIAFVVIFSSYLKKSLKTREEIILLLIFMILIHPLIFQYSFVYRPEVMLMTIGLVSYIFLYHSNQYDSKKYALIAGLFGGLAFLTHLNGISSAVTGFLVLILYRKHSLCAFYSLGVVIISSLYFIDLNTLKEAESYILQFKSDPALVENDYVGIWSYIINLLDEHKRFFRDPKTLFFSGLVLFLVISEYKALKEHAFLKTYTVLLIIIFATLAQSKTTKYMLIYMPYMYLLLGICLQYVFFQSKLLKKYSSLALIVLFILVSLVCNFHLILNNENNLIKHKKIALRHSLMGQKIVAPMPFIFEEIEHENIQSVKVFKFLKDHGKFQHNSSFDFFNVAEHFGNKTIILKPESFELLNIMVPKKGEVKGNYKLVDIMFDEFYIFKLIY